MKLLTAEIKKKLPKLLTNVSAGSKVVCKFFTPDSNWTWYVYAGEEQDGDWMFFGLVHGFEKEWGYFSLSELEKVRGPLGLKVERDMHFNGKIPE